MLRMLRPFWVALVFIWLALGVASIIFAHRLENSYWITVALLPAFLVESFFYLAAGFESARAVFASIGSPSRQALLLLVSGLLPYFILSTPTGLLRLNSFLLLGGLVAVCSFWHVILPRRPAFDIGFLILIAAPLIARAFPRIYLTPDPSLTTNILGHLMWIRVTVLAFLVIRGWDAGPIGFWPSWREWRWGSLTFALAAIALGIAAQFIHFASFAPAHGEWWWIAAKAIGYFFGTFWVVAFFEELFCRGVVLRGLKKLALPSWVAILISSLAFGSVHLWYHQFPNWSFVIMASIAGVFYAMAYLRGGSVRASMVTHALTVTAWRMLFKN
jgi:membrane protease YdiL (CAAX protease family)